MKPNRCALVVAAAVALVGASEIQAQEEQARRRGGPGMGPGVEAIMSMRDRLELTDDQVAALDELRAQEVDRRNDNRAAMEEMRSRLRAGEIDREEMRTFMEEIRSQRPAVEDRRDQLEAILDATQLQTLDELRDRRQRMRRGGDAVGRRGPGMRGGRSGVRGRRPRAMGRMGPRMERIGAMMRGRAEVLERRGEMLERRGRLLERRHRRMEGRGDPSSAPGDPPVSGSPPSPTQGS